MAEVSREHRLDVLHVHYAVPHATAAIPARSMLGPGHRPRVVTTHAPRSMDSVVVCLRFLVASAIVRTRMGHERDPALVGSEANRTELEEVPMAGETLYARLGGYDAIAAVCFSFPA